ncbi:hypothetical protein EC957_007918 [Mortierella hygrophila]|uniref:Uncharacterized protein n=1 Tax=Mortierella hygrophila TaxID=979708 RepID=A0A9P6K5X0_9FUNG|nr:hypothetical protein EC957_007918 [Mortierella hygrophila]
MRATFSYPRHRVDGTGIDQRFRVDDIEASVRHLAAQARRNDNFVSVLVTTIGNAFRGYNHIRRATQDVVVPVSDPRRIRAFREEILRVMFVEGGQSHSGVESAEGVDPMDEDDDNNDNNDNDNDDNDNGGHDQFEDDGDDTYGNQSDEMHDFSLEMNASLSIPSLYPAPVEYADPHPSRTRSFFALPVYTLDKERNVHPIEQSSWMVFRVCQSGGIKLETGTWMPHFIHERSYGIIRHDKAAQFVEFFGAILLSKAKWFRDALLSTSSGTDLAPMSDQNLAVSHLYRELHLENADDFEPYLQKTIEDLEKSVLTNTRTDMSTDEQHATSSALLSHLEQKESESDAMDVDGDESGAYLTTDKRGRQHHICGYHYNRLYPKYVPGHVETQTDGIVSYETPTGKITAVLTSQDELTALFKIDPDQVGFVSESVITLDWEASIQDIDKLLEFAARFGIADMTISGGDRQEAPATPEQVESETNHVRELLKTTATNLTRVTVNWASKLDVSALLKEMSETREDLLYLAIDDSHLKVLSVIYGRHLAVSRIKFALGDLPSVFGELSESGEPLVPGASFLSGKAQSLEISSGVNWSSIQTRTETTDKFKKMIQASPALTSLAVECPVGFAFKGVVNAIDEIVRPLNSGAAPRLKFRDLIVRNSSENDVVALYDLSQSSQEASVTPLALDVTARSDKTISWISKNLGASVRVLHLIGTTPGCLNSLTEIAESERHPDRLVSLTLLLDLIRPSHIVSLDNLLVFSKRSFKQLALIGQPANKDSRTKMLSTLQTLQGFQVLMTRTAGTEWIEDATNAVHASSSSTVTVVKSAEELVQKVPGFTDAGLDCLKILFNRSEPAITPTDDIIVKLE